MTNKKAVRTVPAVEPQSETTAPTGKLSVSILSKLPSDVKMLEEFQQRNIPNINIIDTMRTAWPGFDKSLLSKCRNYKHYGVGLRREAVKLLSEHFHLEAPEPKRQPLRRKPKRIQCRLTDEMYDRLQLHLVCTGQSMQGFLEHIISDHLKKEAPNG